MGLAIPLGRQCQELPWLGAPGGAEVDASTPVHGGPWGGSEGEAVHLLPDVKRRGTRQVLGRQCLFWPLLLGEAKTFL